MGRIPNSKYENDNQPEQPEPHKKGMINIAPPFSPPQGSFQHELMNLLNHYSIENGSNTPDFILAEYLRCCLDSFDMVTRRRDEWYGFPSTI